MNEPYEKIEIILNGRTACLAAGLTVAEMLAAKGFGGKGVAVEVNRQIVPRKRQGLTLLEPGDVVEVVSFVGGG